MISAEELLKVTKNEQASQFALGTMQGGKVKFDGQSTVSQKVYKKLNGITLADNDRVLMLKISGTHIILGKIV